MNDLKKLKKHYDKKGWVVYKKLFSINEIKTEINLSMIS